MTEQITQDDIAGWSSLDRVSESFQKRGLVPREDLGEDYELVMGLADDRFISILAVSPTEDARSWNVPTNPFKVKYTLGRLPHLSSAAVPSWLFPVTTSNQLHHPCK